MLFLRLVSEALSRGRHILKYFVTQDHILVKVFIIVVGNSVSVTLTFPVYRESKGHTQYNSIYLLSVLWRKSMREEEADCEIIEQGERQIEWLC